MNKVVIWGYKPMTHTHSWIHDGFYRAFSAMGHETYWFDEFDDTSGFDFSDSLILSEALAMKGMPIRKDCVYVLHNAPQIDGLGRRLNIQYMTRDAYKFEKISHGISVKDDCVYCPWGSPLLPHEFNLSDVDNVRTNEVFYIGTVNSPGENANYEPVAAFARSAVSDGKIMKVGGGYTGRTKNPDLTYLKGWVTKEDEAAYLRRAYMAPALQGENQLPNGMIPCRLFKAISYGNDGVTNNDFAYEFFDGNVVFGENPSTLYYHAKHDRDKQRILDLMKFVRDKHTYINNVQAILKAL